MIADTRSSSPGRSALVLAMDKSGLPSDEVPKGVAAVRGYRRERAAMRTALRSALRAARTDLRVQRAGTLAPPAPPAADAPPQDAPIVVVRPPPPFERAAPSDAAEPSVLARLLQTVIASEPPSAAPAETPVTEAPTEVPPEVVPAPEPVADVEATAPLPEPPRDMSLARLGFGIGMSTRLNQLGIHNTPDLAAVDPARLREALGEISRLVDIDAWVAQARAFIASR